LEKVWSGPLVTAYRVGGFIEVVPLQYEDAIPNGDAHSKRSKWLHWQDWLFAEAYVLCFANGVMQFTCRHVNNHRFDEGREQNDIVPIVGFTATGNPQAATTLDGSQTRFPLGDATLDITDAAPMISREHPGSLRCEDDLIVYQPYEGIEITGDGYGRHGDGGHLVRASERKMPKGVAKTIQFAASLSDVAPVISRLTVPEWWYALGGDRWPDEVLPVRDYWDKRMDAMYSVVPDRRRGCFDVNLLGYLFEGEVPYSQLCYFYRTGNLEHWRRAIRDAYFCADIGFDHSTETFRVHDYPLDGTTAPPGFRMLGTLFGYLETGDPYLLEVSESAASHWYWIDKHCWPRFAYGRDGASIRSLVFLWDYTGNEDYRVKACEAFRRMIQCQQPDGSYRDQGGGTGIHACSHLPVKPWMTNLATDPIIDYLERSGDTSPDLWQSVMKAADFMMQVAVEQDGAPHWPYQIRYADATWSPWIKARMPETDGHLPTKAPLVHGHKARLLNIATRRTGQARYFDQWLRFFDAHWANQTPPGEGCHLFNKTLQHLPYGQAHSWNARWRNGELTIAPIVSNLRQEMQGIILTPRGPVGLRLARSESGNGRSSSGWKIVEQRGPRGLRVVLASEKPWKRGTLRSPRSKAANSAQRIVAPALAGRSDRS
jgi:hypothetical protein